MSEALQALYAGDDDRARSLLRPDCELTVYEAAAFGRIDRLRALLDNDPEQALQVSEDGFTALHLAVFGQQDEAVAVLIDRGADVNRVSDATLRASRRLARRRSSARSVSPEFCWKRGPTLPLVERRRSRPRQRTATRNSLR